VSGYRQARHRTHSKICSEVDVGSFVAELWEFVRVRKKLWLAPIIIIMVVFGVIRRLFSYMGTLFPRRPAKAPSKKKAKAGAPDDIYPLF
jgi:hypothetical protein